MSKFSNFGNLIDHKSRTCDVLLYHMYSEEFLPCTTVILYLAFLLYFTIVIVHHTQLHRAALHPKGKTDFDYGFKVLAAHIHPSCITQCVIMCPDLGCQRRQDVHPLPATRRLHQERSQQACKISGGPFRGVLENISL